MTHITSTPLDSGRPLLGDLAEAIHLHHEFGYAYYRLQRHNSTLLNARVLRLSFAKPINPKLDDRHTYTVEIRNTTASPYSWAELVVTRATSDEAPLLLASLLLGWDDGMVELPYNWTPTLYVCPCCARECRAERGALDQANEDQMPDEDEMTDAEVVECFDNCITCAVGDEVPAPAGEFTGKVFKDGVLVQGAL